MDLKEFQEELQKLVTKFCQGMPVKKGCPLALQASIGEPYEPAMGMQIVVGFIEDLERWV